MSSAPMISLGKSLYQWFCEQLVQKEEGRGG
jgi:hypothetical protein